MAEQKKTPAMDRSKSGGDIVHLHDITAADLLQGLTLAALQDENEIDDAFCDRAGGDLKEQAMPVPSVSEKMFCSYCNTDFTDRSQQTEHYKTDWHRFNLKQKLKGKSSVTEERFEEISGGDMSSLSGSESGGSSSSSEEESLKPASASALEADQKHRSWHVEGLGRLHPRVFFRNANNELLSVYRCIIYSKKNQPEDGGQVISMATNLPHEMTWAIFMTAGGHFAAAIFNKGEVTLHKTFHRYVVRAKRGTAQSSKDKSGNAPKSAGASLRRYNEAALTQDIHDLFEAWEASLKKCDRIFLRAPSFNRATFFGGKSPPLSKTDARIRMIPFQTRRPTHKELLRVYGMLSEIHCYGQESHVLDHIKISPQKTPVTKAKPEQLVPELEKFDIQDAITGDPDIADTDSGTELEIQTELIDLTQHREFEWSRKPRRKKNKKKAKPSGEEGKNSKPEAQPDYDGWTLKMRNELYTACKVGDTSRLTELLDSFNSQVSNDNLSESDQTAADSVSSNSSPLPSTECQNITYDIKLSSETNYSPSDKDSCTNRVPIVTLLNDLIGTPGLTLLHLAAAGGHKDTIRLLMEAGSDPCTKDAKGQMPYLASANKETKNEFRRFVSMHPDKYDFTTAQIPGPLTEEMEAEKKAREAERKKAQKKARQNRLKDRKAEEAALKAEEQDKSRYLALSDREKRALAAERRFTDQMVNRGNAPPVLSRCFECGSDMTGKVPFEYLDYKFCTPKCLKQHRFKPAQPT